MSGVPGDRQDCRPRLLEIILSSSLHIERDVASKHTQYVSELALLSVHSVPGGDARLRLCIANAWLTVNLLKRIHVYNVLTPTVWCFLSGCKGAQVEEIWSMEPENFDNLK